MYPADYFSLFPPFPKKNQVFVAMSFAKQFTYRWEKVICPAVNRVEVNGERLKAHRVDIRTVSDSVLTEILTGISRSRLVFADLTTIGKIDDKPIRNANVLYEVGLAQAVRLPEEVLLFRSDTDPLLFDVANIRVNLYKPDEEPEKSVDMVVETILSTLKEIDLKKHFVVQRAAEALDHPSWWALVVAHGQGEISHPEPRTIGKIVGSFARSQAISRLLEIGALRTQYQKITPDIVEANSEDRSGSAFMRYKCTEFGKALIEYAVKQTGVFEPDMVKYFEENISKFKT